MPTTRLTTDRIRCALFTSARSLLNSCTPIPIRAQGMAMAANTIRAAGTPLLKNRNATARPNPRAIKSQRSMREINLKRPTAPEAAENNSKSMASAIRKAGSHPQEIVSATPETSTVMAKPIISAHTTPVRIFLFIL
ncbi:MAG: hypothetical protein BWX52_01744 [Bacteroidetes bacterium ADurb.Bin013]|nr:MAG: hypothetical protein BWX52_01744 [Bacteroidetes bacterium ADurb.Bin013]